MQEPPASARENRPDSARRAALVAGAAAVLGGVGWLWARRFAPEPLAIDPIPGLDGFFRVPGGAVSAASGWMAGLGDTASAPALDAPGLCAALFGPAPAALPLAVISDPFCPNCRRLAATLPEVAAAEGLVPHWHDWPILGPGSEAAARATLAAEAQGAGAVFRARMLRAAFQPTPEYLADVARGLGLDPDRLMAETSGPVIDARLALTDRAARTLALPGVPALVIGGLVVAGAPGAADLRRLIAAAHDIPPPCT